MSLKQAVSATDHIQGKTDAEIVIVEYGDYQCSYCGEAYPVLKEIMNRYRNKVQFVFRNFPLSEIHQYARPAAIAAEAAALQGKFWEMHDAIYENQQYLSEGFLIEIAKKIQLNMNQFREDIKKSELVQKIDSDFESGVLSGVNGTPSLFVNGRKFDRGAADLLEQLGEIIR